MVVASSPLGSFCPPPHRMCLMAMRKLCRDGDTPQLPPCWRPRYPAPLPQSRSIISSFPARVIGGLVTDGLINSLISASSLPARPPAHVETSPAGAGMGTRRPHCCTPWGHPGSCWESTGVHNTVWQHCSGQPTWPRLPDIGVHGGPPFLGVGTVPPCSLPHWEGQGCHHGRCQQVPAVAHLPSLTLPLFASVTVAAFRLLCAGG